MHLLIGLDEDDERTLAASDAADGGDLDDVVEVLTSGGMRKAHHFVGVHWLPRTRIVAFGPVSALVTLADGSEHEVRAPSARVWTDLELPEHPERVVLRVLDESERSLPVPPQHLVSGVPVGPAEGGHVSEDAPAVASEPTPEAVSTTAASPEVAREPVPPTPVAPEGPEAPVDAPPATDAPTATAGPAPAPAPAIPTFGASSTTEGADAASGSGSSSWARSWARRDETSAPTAAPPPATTESPSATAEPVLPSWGSVAPAVPVRAAAPAPSTPEPPVRAAPPEVPVVSDLPLSPPRDVDSTWAARPVPEADPSANQASPGPRVTPAPAARPAPATSAGSAAGAQGVSGGEAADEVAAPSYDYLFGHTTAADEHRKVLAQLTQPADDDGAHDDDEVLSVPAVADTSDAAVTNAAPAPEVPEQPLPSAPEVADGGLISSVPWATRSPAPATEPEVPTFSGRHTPPTAPSLLPPLNTPPPGARAPQATPLISTGPPPAVRHDQASRPEASQPDHWAAPHATPVLRTPPTVPIATTPPSQPSQPSQPSTPPPGPSSPVPGPAAAEPSFDVPLAASPFTSANPYPATVPAPVGASSHATVDAQDAAADDDETELTVDRSALLEARNAARNQAFSGPSVLAVLCSAGHPTPPHSDRCRVCGASIPPQEPFTMPRPPLGVLRLSTGDVVTLDRSVLLGRAPKLGEGLAAHDRPHVVKVPSPERDVSRNHVEVILEGWHVLVRDLGTTNGTTVCLPGETPVRLRANDQQVLEPGSLVSMADEVSFTFEAAP
ncbi:FHA domain-containing protein [Terrabacter terrigena]|uniref:FHA domain-containing protein n=1 Tax=Terrabacter terrigena TaxID=574718 RepID=A0ABW3MY07_9MICO